MSPKPFQCLSCRIKQAAKSSSQHASRQFHSSPASNARRRTKPPNPAYPQVVQATKTILAARKKQVEYLESHLKPYTAREKELLSKRYTPAQMAAIEAGESAINPRHLVTQGKIRADAFRPTYIDDFSTERPLLDKPTARHLDHPSAQRLNETSPQPSTRGSPDPLNIPGGLASQVAAETDPTKRRLAQQTGISEDDIGRVQVKSLVMHRVVNQTRMGKISSMYNLCIAGNGEGMVGIGEGKSTEAKDAGEQAKKNAIRNMKPIPRYENRTIYGDVEAKVSATIVQLSARPPGFGNRAQHLIFELTRMAGISDLAARTPRSRNKMNVVKAAFKALTSQKLPEDIARSRGRKMVDVRNVYYGGLAQ